MIGRAIYHSPYFLADIEKEIFKNENVPTRTEGYGKSNSLYSRANIKRRTVKSYNETYGRFVSWTKWIENLEAIFI